MTRRSCRRIERLLALAAGGDLAPSQAGLLNAEEHLRICAGCRASAEALTATVDTVRALPAWRLSAEEGAELRRSVWRRIEEDRARARVPSPGRGSAAWRAAGWAAAALLALALLLPWRSAPEKPAARAAARAASATATTPPAAAAAREPQTVSDVRQELAPRIAARRNPRYSRSAPASMPAERVRIELSTPDPDVRIVWLVGPAGEDLPPLSDDFPTTSETTSTIKENPE